MRGCGLVGCGRLVVRVWVERTFCWNIERRASVDGAQVPFCFCRQSSLSDARTDTTMLRWSGFSGVAVEYAAPSWRAASVGWASLMACAIWSEAPMGAAFSERTDIVGLWLVCLWVGSYLDGGQSALSTGPTGATCY